MSSHQTRACFWIRTVSKAKHFRFKHRCVSTKTSPPIPSAWDVTLTDLIETTKNKGPHPLMLVIFCSSSIKRSCKILTLSVSEPADNPSS